MPVLFATLPTAASWVPDVSQFSKLADRVSTLVSAKIEKDVNPDPSSERL